MLCVFAVSCAVAFGCGNKATTITLVTQPASSYQQDTSWTATSDPSTVLSFTIKVDDTTYYYGSESQTTSGMTALKGDEKFSITGFSLATLGTFTAKITYDTASVEFQYTVAAKTVNEAGFASGTGTEADPYIITTLDEFKAMDASVNTNYFKSGVTYCKLDSDIDFSSADLSNRDYNEGILTLVKNCVLDGNGHKIYNVKGTNKSDATSVIYTLNNSTLKNFDYYMTGRVTLFWRSLTGSITVSNVNAYGTTITEEYNTAIYANTLNTSATFENCTNNANLIANSRYVAGFVSWFKGDNTLTFKNCVNNGTIKANNNAAAFYCNYSGVTGKMIWNNCSNNGSVITNGGGTSNMFIAVGANDGSLNENSKVEIVNSNIDSTKKVVLSNQGLFECTANNDSFASFKIISDKVKSIDITCTYYANYTSLTSTGTYVQYLTEHFDNLAVSSNFTNCTKVGKFLVIPVATLSQGVNTATYVNANWGLNADNAYELLNNSDVFGFNVSIPKSKRVDISFTAYDVEGNLLGGINL